MEKIIHAETDCGDIKSATSGPYQVTKQASINTKALGDNILGEPRCLTLKKYIIDGDDDFELDFEMTTDIEEYDELPTEENGNFQKR
ncbi:hypothetical protein TNIN_389191 [Trichonephila inaurata madagascariensis]|uniref:Uncharacterized protein n=1 Tax=Trichonephila inaurata madagascariensis TaxID=2747483 RepID=A0A8X6JKV4_9ARAC|nr:hypothetical protein TNIN_389191 [Trichonephila inaurata madagascariensis]